MKPLLAFLLLVFAIPTVSTANQPDANPLSSKPDIGNGERLFASCTGCHGADGTGMKDGSVPAIAGQHWQVLTKLLLDFRYFRRWDSRMVKLSASDHLRDPQEIADVVEYVSGLPPSRNPGIGTGEHAALGAKAYERHCASCHGSEAQGDGPGGYPRLAGQQFAYLTRQIRNGVRDTRPTFSRRHVRLLRDLKPAEQDGVADYLSRLGSAVTP